MVESNQEASNLSLNFRTSKPSRDCTKLGRAVPSSNFTVSWRGNDWTSLAPVNAGQPCSTEAKSAKAVVVMEAD
ncbi:hypothetical protein V6Z11_A11G203400 [Gossypium hirsutum]